MEGYGEFINLSKKNLTQEQKEMMEEKAKSEGKRLSSVYVLYELEDKSFKTFLLDRVPMSPKILTLNGVASLVEPIVLSCPLIEKSFSVDDLIEANSMDKNHYQHILLKELIEHEKKGSELNKVIKGN